MTLSAATAATEAARANLAAATLDVERKTALCEQYQQDVALATAALERNEDLEASEALVNQLRVAEARARSSQNILRRSQNAQGLAGTELQVAERNERAIRDELIRLEAERIAQRLAALRSEERELCARLLESPIQLTGAALAALESPPARPSSAAMTSGGRVVHDIYSRIGGDFGDERAAGQEFWREFDASIDRDPSPREHEQEQVA